MFVTENVKQFEIKYQTVDMVDNFSECQKTCGLIYLTEYLIPI